VATLDYFAFGSNLPLARLCERAPSARVLGAARLAGFRLCLDKLASDGSGKLNLAPDADACVWGVVFQLDPTELASLDGFEPGYTRISVSVGLRGGGACEAQTYLSEQRAQGLRAAPWYKALILAGAREHQLPADWIEHLERLPVRDA
jgi:gamma-glutamylcyclotransferase